MNRRFQNFFRNPETRPLVFKTIGFAALFGITFYAAFGMTRSFFTVHAQKVDKEKELKNIEERVQIINSESGANDDFKKEKALREKLYMVKPGEDLIIIVPDEESRQE